MEKADAKSQALPSVERMFSGTSGLFEKGRRLKEEQARSFLLSAHITFSLNGFVPRTMRFLVRVKIRRDPLNSCTVRKPGIS